MYVIYRNDMLLDSFKDLFSLFIWLIFNAHLVVLFFLCVFIYILDFLVFQVHLIMKGQPPTTFNPTKELLICRTGTSCVLITATEESVCLPSSLVISFKLTVYGQTTDVTLTENHNETSTEGVSWG